MTVRLPALVLALAAAALLAPVLPAHADDSAGPLVGHVTDRTATLWFYPGSPVWVRAWYRPDGAAPEEARSVDFPRGESGARRFTATIEGLSPDTTYRFRVTAGGRTRPSWVGRFRTAPAPGTATRFRLAVASCMDPDHDHQRGWGAMRQTDPQVVLLLGDNHYADSTHHGVLWRHYLEMRRIAPFAEVVRHAATYAMWDDHDFAGDDLGGLEVPGRGVSLSVFREVWANPAAGLPRTPGAFFRFSWGDVDFFVLDGRYHRSPLRAQDDARKRMLGDAQIAWLAEGLRASRARFKVIASGSTLDRDEDSWARYRHDRDRVFGLIRTHRVPGVLWLSGDLHASQVEVHPVEETGFYDLVEVISSGIAVGSKHHSFATLDFDTARDDPFVTVRILSSAGETLEEREVLLSRLQMD